MSDAGSKDDYEFYFEQAVAIKELQREKEFLSQLEARSPDEYERQKHALVNIDRNIERLRAEKPDNNKSSMTKSAIVTQKPKKKKPLWHSLLSEICQNFEDSKGRYPDINEVIESFKSMAERSHPQVIEVCLNDLSSEDEVYFSDKRRAISKKTIANLLAKKKKI